MSTRRRKLVLGGAAFNPASLFQAMLRVPHSSTVVTGLGISSLFDTLNNNPAVQATDGARPPRVASAGNGVLVMQGVDDRLSLPAIAANNGLTNWMFATHLLLDDVAAVKTLLRYGLSTANSPQATDSHILTVRADESVRLQVFTDALGTSSRGATSSVSKLNNTTYTSLIVEVALGQTGESNKIVMSFDGVPDTLSFADLTGTPGAMPVALQGQPAGTDIAVWGERTNSLRLPFIGKGGPNLIWTAISPMAGVTKGLLTDEARLAISALDRPS